MKDWHKCKKMWSKKRFQIHKYENGQGWLVWDTKMKRTYRSFLNQDDARECAKILNNNKLLKIS